MNKKKYIRTLIAILATLGVVAFVLEKITSSHGPFLPVDDYPRLAYGFSLGCDVATILASFYAIRQLSWSATLRLFLLGGASLLTLLDYYMFYDTNILACLPILALASLFVLLREWPK